MLSGPGSGLSTDLHQSASATDPPTILPSLPQSLGLRSEAQWGDVTWAHPSSPMS